MKNISIKLEIQYRKLLKPGVGCLVKHKHAVSRDTAQKKHSLWVTTHRVGRQKKRRIMGKHSAGWSEETVTSQQGCRRHKRLWILRNFLSLVWQLDFCWESDATLWAYVWTWIKETIFRHEVRRWGVNNPWCAQWWISFNYASGDF